jgi:membrane protein
LTVGPLAVALIFLLDGRVDEWISTAGSTWQWIAWLAGGLWSFTIIWLLMFGLYIIVPNTQVAWRQALVGALVAAVLIQGGKSFMGGYIATFLTTRQLYGSLGLVPLLMFWIYIMWLVVLFGLEVAATLQSLGGRRHLDEMEQKRQRSGVLDPASILLVMQEIALRFVDGKTSTLRRLAESTSMPEVTVADMVNRLQEAGLVHRIDGESSGVTLARPPERITADELMEVGFQMADDGRSQQKTVLMQRLRQAQQTLASDANLAMMLDDARRASDQLAEDNEPTKLK